MALPRPTKRQRLSGSVSPLTPLTPDDSLEYTGTLLERATHVLRTEANALVHVSRIYESDGVARDGLIAAVQAVLDAHRHGGKVIVCGVGKSAYIAQKLTATMKSFSVRTSFMHACEAAHGDLGDIRTHDVVLFVSFSGKTPELLNLLPHIPKATCILALTAHTDVEKCPLLAGHLNRILLPAPIPEKEEDSFGVCAPTTSTTVALAVADMLALTVADRLHQGNTKAIFQKNHPGGAIGITLRETEIVKEKIITTVVELPSPSVSATGED